MVASPWRDGFGGNLQFRIKEEVVGPRPDNDDCSDSQRIALSDLPFRDEVNIASGTFESGENGSDCGGSSESGSVWYQFTNDTAAPHSLVASTMGSDFDTILQVYEGNCSNLIPVTCDDDSAGNLTSEALFVAEAGKTYAIRASA